MSQLFHSQPVIGRAEEREILETSLREERSHFVAVYGRRRIGKSFLIAQVLGNHACFDFVGAYRTAQKRQLANF
jgi:uncharacterized protein